MKRKRTEELTMGEEEILFFMQMGFTLSSWATVEIALLKILQGAFEVDMQRKALAVGFFSLEGARAKREFTEATVNRVLAGHPLRRQWIVLIDRVRQATDKRNSIAHWQFQIYPHARPGRRYALEHPIQSKKRPKTRVPLPKPGALCLRELVKVRSEFLALERALENFLARLGGVPAPYPEADEQPENPPQIGQLRRQMLEVLARILRESGERSGEEENC